MNNIDFHKFQQLRKENEELKHLIKEGREIFENVSDILNLKKIAESNMLFAKLPAIIRKIQDNPELINNVIQFIDKIKKYENTGNFE